MVMKRHLLHREPYTSEEKRVMVNVHKAFKAATGAADVPDILKMKEDGSASLHQIADSELQKKNWVRQLKNGLLKTKADAMIGNLCDYLQGRYERLSISKGNPNDPYNLVCCELSHWLTNTLSGAACNEQTFKEVNARLVYIDSLRNLFRSEDHHRHKIKTALDEIKATLQSSVILTIKREIANTHATEHLESLQELGKIILDLGFQIAYHLGTNIPNIPSANMTRFRKLEADYRTFAETRLGQILLAMIRTADFKQFFLEQFEQTPTTQSNHSFDSLANRREVSTRAVQISNNPFLNKKNQLCIPFALGSGSTIKDYLRVDPKKPVNVGIYPSILDNDSLIENFIRFLALLIELSKIFSACGDAKALAGIGGDLLVYGFSHEQTTRTMQSLKRCCEVIKKEQQQMISTCNNFFATLTREAQTDKPEHCVWVGNFKKVHSLQTELVKYLDCCIAQADFVTERAKLILTEEWLKEAEQQTMQFVESTMRLNHHIDFFLAGKATPDFDPKTLPWNKVVAPPLREDGVFKIELVDDEDDDKDKKRGQLTTKLRTSLKDLFNIGGSKGKPAEEEAETETESPPKQEQLPKTLRNSLSNLFKIAGKDSKNKSGDFAENPAEDPLLASSPRAVPQLPRKLRTSARRLSSLFGSPSTPKLLTPGDSATQSRNGSAAPSRDVSAANSPVLPRSVDRGVGVRRKTISASVPASSASNNPFVVVQPDEEITPAIEQLVEKAPPPKKAPALRVELIGDKTSYLEDSNICCFLQQSLTRRPQANNIQLQRNQITAKVANRLCTLLGAHKPLEKLDLSRNKNLFSKVDNYGEDNVWVGAKAVSNLMLSHPALKEMTLIECGLTSEGACTLSTGFSLSRCSEHLDISYNKVEDEGAIAICNAAVKVSTLRVINLAGNSIKGKCTDSIVTLLRTKAEKKEPFEVLDLSSNALTDNDAIAICKAAATNPEFTQLKSLSLGFNKLTDQCAPAVIALLSHSHIINLNLEGNELPESSMKKVRELLSKNQQALRLAKSESQEKSETSGNSPRN